MSIDVVRYPGELDTTLEVVVSTNPYLDNVIESCAAAEPASLALPAGAREAEARQLGRVSRRSGTNSTRNGMPLRVTWTACLVVVRSRCSVARYPMSIGPCAVPFLSAIPQPGGRRVAGGWKRGRGFEQTDDSCPAGDDQSHQSSNRGTPSSSSRRPCGSPRSVSGLNVIVPGSSDSRLARKRTPPRRTPPRWKPLAGTSRRRSETHARPAGRVQVLPPPTQPGVMPKHCSSSWRPVRRPSGHVTMAPRITTSTPTAPTADRHRRVGREVPRNDRAHDLESRRGRARRKSIPAATRHFEQHKDGLFSLLSAQRSAWLSGRRRREGSRSVEGLRQGRSRSACRPLSGCRTRCQPVGVSPWCGSQEGRGSPSNQECLPRSQQRLEDPTWM